MATKQISFSVTKDESNIIISIVDRAEKMAAKFGRSFDRMSCHMDVTATHANGTPLKLAELLAADDANFAHDVFGIERHIDRRTGELTDCFLPRFAQ